MFHKIIIAAGANGWNRLEHFLTVGREIPYDERIVIAGLQCHFGLRKFDQTGQQACG